MESISFFWDDTSIYLKVATVNSSVTWRYGLNRHKTPLLLSSQLLTLTTVLSFLNSHHPYLMLILSFLIPLSPLSTLPPQYPCSTFLPSPLYICIILRTWPKGHIFILVHFHNHFKMVKQPIHLRVYHVRGPVRVLSVKNVRDMKYTCICSFSCLCPWKIAHLWIIHVAIHLSGSVSMSVSRTWITHIWMASIKAEGVNNVSTLC